MCAYVSELNLHVKALVINFPAFSESNELLRRELFLSLVPFLRLISAQRTARNSPDPSENPCGNPRERQPERDGRLQTREYGKQGTGKRLEIF